MARSGVSSAPSTVGQTFEVTFPKLGNYEIVCLVHSQMFGMIHVLDPSAPLPYDQTFYDKQAEEQQRALFENSDAHTEHEAHHHSMAGMLTGRLIPHAVGVTAGTGEIAATPGGAAGAFNCTLPGRYR